MWMSLAVLIGWIALGSHGTGASMTTITSALPSSAPVIDPRFIGWSEAMFRARPEATGRAQSRASSPKAWKAPAMRPDLPAMIRGISAAAISSAAASIDAADGTAQAAPSGRSRGTGPGSASLAPRTSRGRLR